MCEYFFMFCRFELCVYVGGLMVLLNDGFMDWFVCFFVLKYGCFVLIGDINCGDLIVILVV